jgi:hypothetical protein
MSGNMKMPVHMFTAPSMIFVARTHLHSLNFETSKEMFDEAC